MPIKAGCEEFIVLFSTLIGKSVKVSFDTVSFESVLKEVKSPRLSDVLNAPDKVFNGTKNVTPAIVSLIFEDGTLHFCLPDVEQKLVTLKGVAITLVSGVKVEFEV